MLATAFRGRRFNALREHCARVFHVLETRSCVLTEIHPTELCVVAAVARLAAYSHRWLRKPEEWQPDETADAGNQWASLLRHLLARYPVPSVRDQAWEIRGSLEHFERDCWCAIAQGQSLRAVPGFPRSIPRRVVHAALTVLDYSQRNGGIAELIWRAELSGLQASSELQAAVLASRIPRELGEHRVWRRLVAKFAAYPGIPAEEIRFASNALGTIATLRGRGQVERLLKLPVRELIRHCRGFVRRLLDQFGSSTTAAVARAALEEGNIAGLLQSRWPPMLGLDCFTLSDHARRESWLFEELCSVAALEEEGRVLKHCVASYAARCRTGQSAIFSLRCREANGDAADEVISYATIEVRRATRRIVQIRAYRNRSPNNTIMRLVREWASKHDLIDGR